MTVWIKIVGLLLAVAAVVGMLVFGYRSYNQTLQNRFEAGFKAGKTECETLHKDAANQARETQITDAQDALQQAAQQGAAHEERRDDVDARFNALLKQLAQARAAAQKTEKGLHDAKQNSNVDCVLPDNRLRIWRQANQGGADSAKTDKDTATSQSTSSATSVTTTQHGQSIRSRKKSFASGAAISPVSDTNVRTVSTSQNNTSGLQQVD